MKKKLLLIPIFLLFLTGCKKQTILSFEGQELNSSFIEIFELSDGRKVYSTFAENYYLDGDTKIELSEALENEYITVDDIIAKMEYHDALNDGGSIIYKYSKDDNNLANRDFYLASCNSYEGNGGITDIFIGNDMSISENCTKKEG